MTEPYYRDDHVTLYLGDCAEILPSLWNIDMVFTSPPYNLGHMTGSNSNLSGGYRSYHDTLPDAEYVKWQQDVLTMCWETLNDTGAIFYNHKPLIKDGEVTMPTRLNPGLPLRQIIIWYRNWGANWSPSHFLPVHEWIMVMAKRDFRLKSRDAAAASDVWAVHPEKGIKDGHPASFPIGLPGRAMDATKPGMVLDPFAGIGTTLLAAKERGRKAIGIEIDEAYCELAAKRMEQQALDFYRESVPDLLPTDATAQLFDEGDWDGAA